MVWWMGVIENINDPLGIDRVQVRCIHWHSEDKAQLPSEDLPWAPVINAGTNLTDYLPGQWVVGFFIDGQEAQQPIVWGRITGIPQSKDNSLGFSDPSGTHPRTLQKPDNSPLARGDLSGPNPITYSRGSVTKGVKNAAGSSWDEPQSAYGAIYPNNHVIETDAKNAMEMDDTPGKERIHIFHCKGSLIEFHPDGKVVHRVLDSGYEIVVKDKNVAIGGDLNFTATGNINLLAGGSINLGAGKDMVVKIDGEISTSSNKDTKIKVGGAFEAGAATTASIKAGAEFAVDAAGIDLNSGVAQDPGAPEKADKPDNISISKFDSGNSQ